MKILKRIFFGIVILIAFIFLSGLFIPNAYTVSSSINIKQPSITVFEYAKMLDNQKYYSVWVMADPNLIPTITGVDGTVGAMQCWDSQMDEVGQGCQTITSLDNKSIKMDLMFKRPFESVAKAAILFEEVSANETKVTSEFYGNESFPKNIMPFYLGRFFIKDAIDKNLSNLKNILESK